MVPADPAVAHGQEARVAQLGPVAGSATQEAAPEVASEVVVIQAVAEAQVEAIAVQARQVRVCAVALAVVGLEA
ncbi:MAG TPA: hypothetical protein VEY08_00885 [Chloroflexia bacterium]|nr:hypothetical protein [Chloroflexia bacterium]